MSAKLSLSPALRVLFVWILISVMEISDSFTLASAATLIFIGRVLDDVPVVNVAVVLIVLLAGASLMLASANSVAVLLLSIYLLRLLGQGMMSHTAMVAMGHWFVLERGRAVSVTTIGHQIGEGLLPLFIVAMLGWVGWRSTWMMAAAVLIVVALPLSYVCLSMPRSPSQQDRDNQETGSNGPERRCFAMCHSGPFVQAYLRRLLSVRPSFSTRCT